MRRGSAAAATGGGCFTVPQVRARAGAQGRAGGRAMNAEHGVGGPGEAGGLDLGPSWRIGGRSRRATKTSRTQHFRQVAPGTGRLRKVGGRRGAAEPGAGLGPQGREPPSRGAGAPPRACSEGGARRAPRASPRAGSPPGRAPARGRRGARSTAAAGRVCRGATASGRAWRGSPCGAARGGPAPRRGAARSAGSTRPRRRAPRGAAGSRRGAAPPPWLARSWSDRTDRRWPPCAGVPRARAGATAQCPGAR